MATADSELLSMVYRNFSLKQQIDEEIMAALSDPVQLRSTPVDNPACADWGREPNKGIPLCSSTSSSVPGKAAQLELINEELRRRLQSAHGDIHGLAKDYKNAVERNSDLLGQLRSMERRCLEAESKLDVLMKSRQKERVLVVRGRRANGGEQE